MSRSVYGLTVYLLGIISMAAFAGAMEQIGRVDDGQPIAPAQITMLLGLLTSAIILAWWIIRKRLSTG